ncbi:MAG: DUF4349 domain-containing protein [Chloroflexota bacterium]|nr:DUF4349 domain-containing protein [Chloroflexota bacterium]
MNKWFKFSIPIFLIGVLMLVSSCATAPVPMPTPTPRPAPSESYLDGKGHNSDITVPEEMATERKIVRTGYMTLEVEDVADAIDEVARVAKDLDGYVVSSQKYEDEKTAGSISIRVPAERFNEALERLRQLAISVPTESTQSKDVTEEYVDLEARLRNLKATEAQYLILLEKAETVEEMLKVQEALSRIRGEIEQIEGRMQYLERTSDMALIEISLKQTKPLAGSWSPVVALKSAIHGIVTFGRGLLTALIWLGIFCWVWIPILVIWLRRRKKKV